MSSHHPSSFSLPTYSSPCSSSSNQSPSSSSSNMQYTKDVVINEAVDPTSNGHQQQAKSVSSEVNVCECGQQGPARAESFNSNEGSNSPKVLGSEVTSVTFAEAGTTERGAGNEPRKRHRVGFGEIVTRKLSATSWMRRDSRIGMFMTEEGRRGSDLMSFFTGGRSRSPTLNPANCKRLQQPRLSLLGRPIICKPIKQRDPRYRRTQVIIHNFLERPRGTLAIFYHLLQ